jgi:hypothetical protein
MMQDGNDLEQPSHEETKPYHGSSQPGSMLKHIVPEYDLDINRLAARDTLPDQYRYIFCKKPNPDSNYYQAGHVILACQTACVSQHQKLKS